MMVWGVAIARPQSAKVEVALTGVGVVAGTGTLYNVNGYIHEITVVCSDDTSTGIVAVAYTPQDYTNSAVSLATGTATSGEKRWRPRVDGTTVAGSANTSDAPDRFMLVKQDKVTFALTYSQNTNVTWRCRIKYDDGK